MDLQNQFKGCRDHHLSRRGEQFYRQLLSNVSEGLNFSQDVMWEMGPYSKADFGWLFRASGPLAPITHAKSGKLGGKKALGHTYANMQGDLCNFATLPPVLPPIQTIRYRSQTTNDSSIAIPTRTIDQQGPSGCVKQTGLRRVSIIYQPFKAATTSQQKKDSQSRKQDEPVLKEQTNTTVQQAVSKQIPRQGQYKAGLQSLLKDQSGSASATDLVIKELVFAEDFCDASKPRSLQTHNAETPQPVYNRVQNDFVSAVCLNDQGATSQTANYMPVRQMEIPKLPCLEDSPIRCAGKDFHHTKNNFELELYSGMNTLEKEAWRQVDLFDKTACTTELGLVSPGHNRQNTEPLATGAESWIAAQSFGMVRDTSKAVIERLLSQLFDSDSPSDQEQAAAVLASISSKTILVRFLLAEKLNSPNWRDRALACNTISQLKCPINKDLTNKLLYLMWNDRSCVVRQEARHALEKLGMVNEIHNDLRAKLDAGPTSSRVEALVLIGQLKITTAKLLPSFLRCLNDDFGVVREQACLTAACLRIKDEMVLNQLIQLMQNDPSCNVKVAAINALEKIGCMPPKLQENLLWVSHHEEEQKVHIAAYKALKSLGIKNPEPQNLFQKHVHLDPDPQVQRHTVHLMESYGYSLDWDQETVSRIKQQVQQLCTTSIITDKVLLLEELQQQSEMLGKENQADATLVSTLLQERLKGSENKPRLLFQGS